MPRRPTIRPGSPLLRRDAHHLQLGPVILRDRPGLTDLLRVLDGATEIPDALCVELELAGAVIDAGHWPGGVPRAELHHAALTHTDPLLTARRRHLRVAVTGDCPEFADFLDLVLKHAGAATSGPPTILVIATLGEPPRSVFDACHRDGIPHLPVAFDGLAAHIGPLVLPGVTACLRCHDTARATWDPTWPALVSQFGCAHRPERAVDALGLNAAAAFAARDLIAHAEGRDVETIGNRITLTGETARFEPVPLAPGCACHLDWP